MSTQASSFAAYGKSFQEKIIQALLVDKQFAEQMTEVMNIEYFELKYLQYLANKYFSYARKYKEFPTFDLLITIIKDDLKNGSDVILRDQIVELLKRIRTNPDPGDLPFVKEKSLDFCRKQALKSAIEKAIDLVSTEKYESIVEIIKTAVSVGTTPSVGHDFINDFEARFVRLKREVVPTGLEQLDKKEILQGGLGRGEIGVVVGNTGTGKSHFLVNLGCNAMREGKNVLHYTFELSETAVAVRYDSNLCDMNSNEVLDKKEEIHEKYSKMKLGRLFIKEYPTSTCTVHMIRNHVEKLSLKGFIPDMILIDYADIMRSSRQFDSLRHELKLIYEELRGLATELQLPIWTASQANRDSSNSEIVGLESMSEAYGKAMVADVILTISRRSHEKASGQGRLFVAKNRAGRDGLVYPVLIDTSKSYFKVTGDNITMAAAEEEDQSTMKQALRNKWQELQKEDNLVVKKN